MITINPKNKSSDAVTHLPRHHLPRPRLSAALLDTSTRIKLICAPAGAGKTVLLEECISNRPKNTHIVRVPFTSIQLFCEALAKSLNLTLEAPESVCLETIKEQLSKEERPTWIIIDDFCRHPNIEAELFLEKILTINNHSITWWISSRRPLLSFLIKLSIEGEISSIQGLKSLSFTRDEAISLSVLAGTSFSNEEIAIIHQQTEGWCIAIRCYLLSNYTYKSATHFPESLDLYLQAEFLSQLPINYLKFWLVLAHLEKFNTELLSFVLKGSEENTGFIQNPDLFGAFIEPIKNQLGWLQVFRPLSRYFQQSGKVTPELPIQWHTRASEWFSLQGDWHSATLHAAQAGKDDEALSMMQLITDETSMNDESAALLFQLYETVSSDIFYKTPRLLCLIAGALVLSGQLTKAQQALDKFYRFFPQPSAALQQGLLAQWQTMTGWKAHLAGQHSEARQYFEEAMQWLDDDSWELKIMVCSALTQQHLATFDFDQARQFNRFGLKLAREKQSPLFEAYVELDNSIMIEHLDTLHAAKTSALRAQRILKENILGKTLVTDRIALRTGHIHFRQGEYQSARNELSVSLREHRTSGDPRIIYSFSTLALLDAFEGDFTRAHERLYSAERTMQRKHIHEAVYRPQLLLTKGKVLYLERHYSAAHLIFSELLNHYEKNNTLSPPPGSVEFLPRLHLAAALTEMCLGAAEQANNRLDQLLSMSKEKKLLSLEAEIILAQAQAHYLKNDTKAAREKLEEATKKCSALGLVEPVDTLGKLLPKLLKENRQADFLSSREQEVITLIATGLSNQQISDTLKISLHTVKAHTQSIYRKLDVERRTQAVAKAKQLGLLATPSAS